MKLELGDRSVDGVVVDEKLWVYRGDLLEAFGYKSPNACKGMPEMWQQRHLSMGGWRTFISLSGGQWLARKAPVANESFVDAWRERDGETKTFEHCVDGVVYDVTVSHEPSPNEALALVEVDFYGDKLLGTKSEQGKVFVALRPMCEALGITLPGQLEKLRGVSWAVVTMIVTTGQDGKNYEQACLELDSVPMWLATIHESKVDPHVAAKLVRYQRECKDALAKYFFGSNGSASEFASALVEMRKCNAEMRQSNERIAVISEHVAQVVSQIQKVDSRVGLLEDKIEVILNTTRFAVHQRKDFSDKDKRRMLRAVLSGGGRCPCCQLVEIVEGSKELLQKKPGVEFDHFENRSLNSISKGWPICGDCHRILTSGGPRVREVYRPHFLTFQSLLERSEAKAAEDDARAEEAARKQLQLF